MTTKMLNALRLLVEHGDGDISHDQPTAVYYGTPTVNLRTALALDKLGYVHAFEQSHWLLWGNIELQPKGEQLVRELKERDDG